MPAFRTSIVKPAQYAGRVLNGAKSADRPATEPVKFDLVVNLNTAKALGIVIPPKLLAIAEMLG